MAIHQESVELRIQNGGPQSQRCSASDQPDPEHQRGHWDNPLDFFVSCLGYAVGLGNFWRFPMLCFQYGGGSFLVPYVLMLFCAGMPMLFLEVALGQYAGAGPIKIFGRMTPIAKGLGHAVVCVGALLSLFYNVVVSWAIWYFFTSISSYPLDWATCGHEYNTEKCFSKQQQSDCAADANDTLKAHFYNNSCTDISTVCSVGNFVAFNETHCAFNGTTPISTEKAIGHSSSVVEFWALNVLGDDTKYTWDNFGTPRLSSIGTLFFAWFLVAVCLIKGVKSSGKAVYVTSFFPYVLLLILGIRSFMLPGAGDGILVYLTPKWEQLKSFDLWVDAATQIIFSLGPACGCVITLSSYNKLERNCHKDTICVAILNSLTSFYCGFVVFAILGFMAHQAEKPVTEVVKGGPGLAFIVYPEVVTLLGSGVIGNIFAAIFFLMLITLALGCIFAAFETIISAVSDEFPALRGSKPLLVISLSVATFVLGLPFTCPGGIHMFTLFNASAPSWNLLFFALLEVVVVAWFYGADKFLDDMTSEMGIRFGRVARLYWMICWKFLTPAILFVLLILAWTNFGHVSYNKDYVYPLGIQILGYMITACTIIWIPVYAGIEIYKVKKSGSGDYWSLIRPRAKWGRQCNREEETNQSMNRGDLEGTDEGLLQH